MDAVDQKTLLLDQKYGDNVYVSTTMREVEQIRNQATNLGIVTSLAAFGLNEVARLTLRSRKCLGDKLTRTNKLRFMLTLFL